MPCETAWSQAHFTMISRHRQASRRQALQNEVHNQTPTITNKPFTLNSQPSHQALAEYLQRLLLGPSLLQCCIKHHTRPRNPSTPLHALQEQATAAVDTAAARMVRVLAGNILQAWPRVNWVVTWISLARISTCPCPHRHNPSCACC
jgi:hypothetical protein